MSGFVGREEGVGVVHVVFDGAEGGVELEGGDAHGGLVLPGCLAPLGIDGLVARGALDLLDRIIREGDWFRKTMAVLTSESMALCTSMAMRV